MISAFVSARARLARLSKREDFTTGIITAFAALVFVWTASRTAKPTLDGIFHAGGGADRVAIIALLLNVALIIFAWSRHRDAQKAMRQRTAAEHRAQLLKTRDQDTDLLNRSAFRDRGGMLVERALEQRSNVALMVINLNRFKKINEIYGDAVGDAFLRIIALVILGNVPRDAVCARLGSDEFAIALPFQNVDEDKVLLLADDLLTQLNLPVELMGATLQVSASIGLSRLGFDCMDFSALLRRADLAMNAPKEKAR